MKIHTVGALPHALGSPAGQHPSLAVPRLMQDAVMGQHPPAQQSAPPAQHIVRSFAQAVSPL